MPNDADIEEFILTELAHNEEYARSVIPYIKPDYFSDDVEKIVYEEIKSHFDEFNTLPNKKALAIDVGNRASLFEKQYDRATELIDYMYDSKYTPQSNPEWGVNRTENWCKEKAIYNAVLESAQIIDPSNKAKDKKPFSAIESIVREALSVTFDASVGHDYYNDAEARYDFYHSKTEKVPFGIDTFNEITDGGLPNKTLNVILAGVHVGKSMFMCDYAANCLRQGKKVLYITCEMAEERIAERIDANLFDCNIKDLSTLSKTMYSSRVGKMKTSYGASGGLKIKEYPTATANVSHFRALLSELQSKQNFVPQVIIIDYLNICGSMRFGGDSSNSYGFMKSVAEEVRGMAIEHNVPILTAVQSNRSGFGDSDVDMTSTAESFGIPATADMMFALIRTEQLDKHDLLCVKQLKNRYNDPGDNKRFVICMDKPRMKFSEADAAAQALLTSGAGGVATIPGGGGGFGGSGFTSAPVAPAIPAIPYRSGVSSSGGGLKI